MDKETFNAIVDNKLPLWIIKKKNLDIKVFFDGQIEGIESPHDDPIYGHNRFLFFISHLLRMIKHYCPPSNTESLRDLIAKFDCEENEKDEALYQGIIQNSKTNKNSEQGQ